MEVANTKVAIKSDPVLWAKVVSGVKNSDHAGPAGTWNARKAQLAVAEYKSRGGKYKGRKSRKNSLSKWTGEDWGYVDGKEGNRYLPASVRNALTPAEKKTENQRKKSATKKGKQRASYSSSVAAKLRASRKSKGSAGRKSRKSQGSAGRKSQGSAGRK